MLTNIKIKLKYKTYKKNINNFLQFSNKLNFLFFVLPNKSKYYTVVKSPKCFKIGKMIIKYSYRQFFFTFIKKIKKFQSYQFLIFLNIIKKTYLIYQAANIKITTITSYTKIKYTFHSF